MQIDILTPEKMLYSGEADRIQLPGTVGKFEILQDHAPLISSLAEGELKITNGDAVKKILISGGFVEVLNNNVTVLAEGTVSATSAEEA